MRARQPLGLSIGVALAIPAVASAHANLLRTEPANGSVLKQAPREVRVVFDDVVRVEGGARAIRNGGGSVLGGPAHTEPGNRRVLVVPLRAGLPDGDYTVLWRILSDDGHVEAGVLAFAVGLGRAPPAPALSADSRPTAAVVAARWLFLAGLLLVVGTAVFRFAIWRSGAPPRSVELLFVGFVLVFFGGFGGLGETSTSTRFGAVLAAATVVAGVGALLAALATVYPALAGPAALVALLLVVAPTLSGHALDRGRSPLDAVVDVAHVGAAAVWIGGLVSLLLALTAATPTVVRRFSTLALAAVAVLSVTGLIRALSELRAVSQVWSTGYGQLLIAKTVLLAVLVALGWRNRYRLVPALGARAESLRRTLRGEVVLAAGLIVAVAILTAARPGREIGGVPRVASPPAVSAVPSLPPADALVVAREEGRRALALAVAPKGRGVRLLLTVLGADGTPESGLAVGFTVEGTHGSTQGAARPCGLGCYAATAPVSGRPQAVTVRVDRSTGRFALSASWPPPAAGALLARLVRRFRSLRSVAFRERLSSGFGAGVDTLFRMQAPDRLTYAIRGGSAAIVIGGLRWDRVPGSPWLRSAQAPLRLPAPPWEPGVTNIRLLRRSAAVESVAFADLRVPAWFTVLIDRRTLRPLVVRMTAPAHFMVERYVAFDRPYRIRPPAVGR